jgi:hypothetical protein
LPEESVSFTGFDILTMWGTLIALGVAADTYFRLGPANQRLYEAVLQAWNRLDATRVPDFPRRVAAVISSRGRLATGVGLIGCLIIGILGLAYSAKYAILIETDRPGVYQPLFPDTISALRSLAGNPTALWPVLAIQMGAAAVSIGMTLRILRHLSKRNSRPSRLIAAAFVCALALGLGCLYGLDYLTWTSFDNNGIKPSLRYSPLEHPLLAAKGALWLVGLTSGEAGIGSPASALYVGSVLLPSLCFYALVLFGLLLKLIYSTARSMGQRSLWLGIQLGRVSQVPDTLPIGFLSGIALSIALTFVLLLLRVLIPVT